MKRARVRELVDGFNRCRVMVVGDLMLDRYVWGSVERISPEAPVPVVQVERESSMLGGAGNVVRNLASLGASVDVAALVGDDPAAAELLRRMDYWKIEPAGLVVDPNRPTTEKTRVIAGGQQVVRYDKESEAPLDPRSTRKLIEAVRQNVDRLDGAIVQDYGKGLLQPDVLAELMQLFSAHGVRVFVDPKPLPWDGYRGAELVKPNLREAQELVQKRVRSDADLEDVGRAVLAHTGAQVVAITRSEDGMTLFPADGPTLNVPTVKRAVADQAGAGDTAIAALTLARLAGGDWAESAELANAAAGFVVGIPGTATLTQADLLGALGAGF
jgi:D-beta-D-heptose 7-phosphate kinase/D-beta-D-heptose 1-phosphate adenosyltransferase